ncbi:MAG TPA: hypothetical protein VL241_12400 [Gemmatimonadales bacterium]|nr:hypothetical protein [Gemmatimonadales bacterium]
MDVATSLLPIAMAPAPASPLSSSQGVRDALAEKNSARGAMPGALG